MSRKKKIILSILCVVSLFVFYEVWDWHFNRHWIGTTKDTEIVQKHLLPMDEYFPDGDWFSMCGDSPEDYFLVWTDFALFGDHPTLKSGSCGASGDIWLDNPEHYVNTKIVPWMKEQGFSDISIKKYDKDDEYCLLEPGEMRINASPKRQKLDNGKGELEISVFAHVEIGDKAFYNPPNKFLVSIHISYSYVSP